MATQTLTKGYYLRTQVTPHSFTFTLPDKGRNASYESMDEVFNALGGGNKRNTSSGTQTPKGTKSTISSDWHNCSLSHKEIGTKISYASEIYARAQGTQDIELATKAVADYKKHAAQVLQRYYDEGLEPDQAMADLINTKQCVVYEIKIFLMRVTDEVLPGIQPSKKDGLYRQSKVVRKFYTFSRPLESLLNAFTNVMVEVGTNVDYAGRLQLVRSDGKTPRTGKAAGYRHFKIERTTAIGSDNDQQLSALVQKIFAKQQEHAPT